MRVAKGGPPLIRRRIVAALLIEGPHSIHPARRGGLEDLDLAFRFLEGRWPRSMRSVALYCDNTVNRRSNFHPPVVRLSEWDRASEPYNRKSWPLVSVRWGIVRNGKRRIDSYMKTLTRSLGHLPFVTDGFYRNREPAVKSHSAVDDFEVMVMTRLQRLEFQSPRTLADDPLVDVLVRGRDLLQELMKPLRFRGWKECFDYNLSAPDVMSARHWKWSGDVKETGVHSA